MPVKITDKYLRSAEQIHDIMSLFSSSSHILLDSSTLHDEATESLNALSISLKSEIKELKDKRIISRAEFDGAIGNFQQRVLYDGTQSIQLGEQRVLWSNLANIANAEASPKGRACLIFYGLSNRSMRYGFAFVPKIKKYSNGDFTFQETTIPTHYLDHTTHELKQINETVPWETWQTNYEQHVHINRSLIPLELEEKDARHVVFPYEEEVYKLYEDNLFGYLNNEPYITINSISRVQPSSDGGPNGFRHGICGNMSTNPNGSWKDLVTDGHTAFMYHNRAADYGNLCPPRSNRYYSD